MKKIPHDTLVLARREAIIPARKVNPRTEEVFRMAAHLIAHRRSGQCPAQAWGELRQVLDEAMTDGDWTVMDDLAKAWQNVKLSAWVFSSNMPDGTTVPFHSMGEITNPPRAPITVAVIDAISDFQFESTRAPTRQEILDAMVATTPIDETELSRQLGRLGWSDLI